MTRRHCMALACGMGITAATQEQLLSSTVKLEGDFGFRMENGTLHMHAKDVIIDGMSIPKLTWSWIGLAVAEAVLVNVGALILGALSNAVHGESGKSIEQLLKEQLVAIAHIVEEALKENDLRNYQAEIDAYINLFREYQHDNTNARLDFLINNSAVVLSRLESLGFVGYRTYMIAAGLRLGILRESIKRTGRGRDNVTNQFDAAVAHHNEIVAQIDAETDPVALSRRLTRVSGLPDAAGFFHGSVAAYTAPGKILGSPINGWVMVLDGSRELTPREVILYRSAVDAHCSIHMFGGCPSERDKFIWANAAACRAALKLENTELGEKMISRWKKTATAI
jgi:hypothetical protein